MDKRKLSPYLVMRLVLPTDWSPSKTIFVRFGGAEEKSAVTGEVACSAIGGFKEENECKRWWVSPRSSSAMYTHVITPLY